MSFARKKKFSQLWIVDLNCFKVVVQGNTFATDVHQVTKRKTTVLFYINLPVSK